MNDTILPPEGFGGSVDALHPPNTKINFMTAQPTPAVNSDVNIQRLLLHPVDTPPMSQH